MPFCKDCSRVKIDAGQSWHSGLSLLLSVRLKGNMSQRPEESKNAQTSLPLLKVTNPC